MSEECKNWVDHLSWQIDFYLRRGHARRKDTEFEWSAYERGRSGYLLDLSRVAKRLLGRMGRGGVGVSLDWLRENAEPLWQTRRKLADELSRLLFDQSLVLRTTSHQRFYFPRIDFDDLVKTVSVHPFAEEGFPRDYMGTPLGVFEVVVRERDDRPPLKVITRAVQLRLVNSYRQYLVRRDGDNISPRRGDVVLDCGACIGEVSMLFAALVAPAGEVHLFDPMPLHARFCRLQAALNPDYASVLHINEVAVGDETREAQGPLLLPEDGRISPSATSTEDFPSITIDDYARSLRRLDFIKMDIEGAEMDALEGAAGAVQEFRPRLAISGYHKPEDLWEIPNRILQLNPNYRVAFGHHTPVNWESVFYAVDPSADSALPRESTKP